MKSRGAFLKALDARLITTAVFTEMAIRLKKARTIEEEKQIAEKYVPEISKAAKEMAEKLEEWRDSLCGKSRKTAKISTIPTEQLRKRFEHPERRKDEVFFTTCTILGRGAHFPSTAREGNPYQDGLGDRQNENTIFPVFIGTKEAIDLGIISELDVVGAFQCGLVDITEVATLIRH